MREVINIKWSPFVDEIISFIASLNDGFIFAWDVGKCCKMYIFWHSREKKKLKGKFS